MRLSDLDPDELTPEQQEVYEALRNRAQGALPGLIGPFGVWVRAPYYCVVSLTLNAFEVPLPESWTDPFPEEA